MNLGQMRGAIVLPGILIMNANVTLLDTRDVQHTSELGITAISLAASLVKEAGGKLFDNVVVDTMSPFASSTPLISTISDLDTTVPATARSCSVCRRQSVVTAASLRHGISSRSVSLVA